MHCFLLWKHLKAVLFICQRLIGNKYNYFSLQAAGLKIWMMLRKFALHSIRGVENEMLKARRFFKQVAIHRI